MPFLAAVKDAKFRMFVTPGQKFSVKATLVHEGSGYAITKAGITLGDKPICDAELTFRVTDFPSAEMRQKMRETAALVGFPTEVPANG
jgi:3-hydroxyacyl-[acyl-carrier-protein] dehydratase